MWGLWAPAHQDHPTGAEVLGKHRKRKPEKVMGTQPTPLYQDPSLINLFCPCLGELKTPC